MKLRFKTLAVLIITTLCLIASLHFVSEFIILDSFKQLEQTQVSGIIGQVQIALTDEFDHMHSKANTWAKMDNVINYVKDQSISFDSSDKAVSSWVELGVNYVLLYDVAGNYVAGVGFNLSTYRQEPITQELLDEISGNPQVWNLNSIDSSTKGILVVPDGALIVASNKIHPTQESCEGALVMARYLDSAEVASLSRMVQLPVSIRLYSQWKTQDTQPLEATETSTTFTEVIDNNYIIGYYTVKDINGQPAVRVGVTIPRSVYVQGIITVNYVDRLVLISCVVFSVTVALWLEFLFLSKISKLTHAVTSISRHQNPSERLPTKGNDEVESLTKSINGMLDELEDNTHKLQKSERFSAIGELATMIAHDLRNPLQGIAVATYYLKRKINPLTTEKEKEMLQLIEQDVRYSDKIVNDLLDYSRQVKLDLIPASPRELLWRALSIVNVPESIKLVDETADDPEVMVDVDDITRVFTNLISNAVDAMPNGGTLTVKVVNAEEGIACLAFSDTGAGITEETLQKIFQPLFTTKAKGMGFGLSICKRIVEAHGGKIEVESTMGEGATFYVCLSTKKEQAP